jgi:putative OPT family oligopeptide transporter
MMHSKIEEFTGLPENAYRELAPGEEYHPIIPAECTVKEVTGRSIAFGILLGIIFSGASAFLSLKLGQGMEAAIPIAILAVGISAILKRKSTLLENVNIMALGATSGIVVGGSTFTMPAIYILGLNGMSSFLQIFLVPFLGAVLGVIFLIPFRRYFVAQMHGKLPFPEGTATTEVLVAGERGGPQAKILVYSMGLGGIFDFLVLSLGAWRESFTTAIIGSCHHLTTQIKAVFTYNTTAAIAGLGYIIGVEYASIILAGSFMSMFVIVPLLAYLGNFMTVPLTPGLPELSRMGIDELFSNYARIIGIGGIFAAGIISILKMSPVIFQALKSLVFQVFLGRRRADEGPVIRTEDDIPLSIVLILLLVTSAAIWLYFRFFVLASQPHATMLTTLALGVTLLIAFLFASVSAWAVAMISVTPISGMTLMTLVVTALVLAALGLKGREGMLSTLLVGGVVCTALSMTGSLVTQFKISYWLGATPRKIQWSNIIGAAIASIVTTLVIMLLHQTYGFTRDAAHPHALPAPQANAMAAVITSMMGGGEAPWFLYGIGAVIAVIVEMMGISSLAFAMGMYLPMELNSPILGGALVAWAIKRFSKDREKAKLRNEHGILIASGLIAGGSIAGVFGSLLKWVEDRFSCHIIPALGPHGEAGFANTGAFGNWLGLFMSIALLAFIFWDSWRSPGSHKGDEDRAPGCEAA